MNRRREAFVYEWLVQFLRYVNAGMVAVIVTAGLYLLAQRAIDDAAQRTAHETGDQFNNNADSHRRF